jgi:hypothetical protein
VVIQLETESVNFTRLPTVENGILSFSGQNIPGYLLSGRIMVEYNPLPSSLNTNQLNNATWAASNRMVAWVSESQPYDYGMTIDGWFQDIDPHAIPADAPVLPLGESNGEGYQDVQVAVLHTAAASWLVDYSTFSISVDLSQIVSKLGPGIYTIQANAMALPPIVPTSVPGVYIMQSNLTGEIHPLFSYSIIVE